MITQERLREMIKIGMRQPQNHDEVIALASLDEHSNGRLAHLLDMAKHIIEVQADTQRLHHDVPEEIREVLNVLEEHIDRNIAAFLSDWRGA